MTNKKHTFLCVLVRLRGLEPPTNRLKVYCSTNWATGAYCPVCTVSLLIYPPLVTPIRAAVLSVCQSVRFSRRAYVPNTVHTRSLFILPTSQNRHSSSDSDSPKRDGGTRRCRTFILWFFRPPLRPHKLSFHKNSEYRSTSEHDLATEVGFEPTDGFPPAVFKTAAINRTLPLRRIGFHTYSPKKTVLRDPKPPVCRSESYDLAFHKA